MDTPNDPLLTDPSLLGKLCHPGDNEAAWTAFLLRYRPVLIGWCRGLGLQEADAEDVCQSILGTLAQKMPAFRYDPAAGSFRGWLRTTVGNAVRNFWRGRARHPTGIGTGDSRVAELLRQAEDSGSLDTLVGVMDRCMGTDYRLALQAIDLVKGRVKETTWQAFVLTALEGLPGAEVSERLGIAVAHVYVYKDRVCKLLRQTVEQLQAASPEAEETPP